MKYTSQPFVSFALQCTLTCFILIEWTLFILRLEYIFLLSLETSKLPNTHPGNKTDK